MKSKAPHKLRDLNNSCNRMTIKVKCENCYSTLQKTRTKHLNLDQDFKIIHKQGKKTHKNYTNEDPKSATLKSHGSEIMTSTICLCPK